MAIAQDYDPEDPAGARYHENKVVEQDVRAREQRIRQAGDFGQYILQQPNQDGPDAVDGATMNSFYALQCEAYFSYWSSGNRFGHHNDDRMATFSPPGAVDEPSDDEPSDDELSDDELSDDEQSSRSSTPEPAAHELESETPMLDTDSQAVPEPAAAHDFESETLMLDTASPPVLEPAAAHESESEPLMLDTDSPAFPEPAAAHESESELLMFDPASQTFLEPAQKDLGNAEAESKTQEVLHRFGLMTNVFARGLCAVVRYFQHKSRGVAGTTPENPWKMRLSFRQHPRLHEMFLSQWLSIEPRESEESWFSEETLANMVLVSTKAPESYASFGDPVSLAHFLSASVDLETRISRCTSAIAGCATSSIGKMILPRVQMSRSCTSMVLPLNVGRHWLTIELRPSFLHTLKGSIIVYDSLNSTPESSRVTQSLLPVFATLLTMLPGSPWPRQSGWVLKVGESVKQKDWTECGPITGSNCANLLDGESPDCRVNVQGLRAAYFERLCYLLRSDLETEALVQATPLLSAAGSQPVATLSIKNTARNPGSEPSMSPGAPKDEFLTPEKVDALHDRRMLDMNLQRLQNGLETGNIYAPGLLQVAEVFEMADKRRPEVISDPELSNPWKMKLPFNFTENLHALTLEEWFRIERRTCGLVMDSWLDDNTLANMIKVAFAGDDAIRNFGDPVDLALWLSVEQEAEIEPRVKALQAAIREASDHGRVPIAGAFGERRHEFPGLNLSPSAPFMVFPLSVCYHWITVELRPNFETRQGIITVYDSSGTEETLNSTGDMILYFAFLVNLRPDLQWKQTDWKIQIGASTIQTNVVDCGPITLHNCSQLLLRKAPFVYQDWPSRSQLGPKSRFESLRSLVGAFLGQSMQVVKPILQRQTSDSTEIEDPEPPSDRSSTSALWHEIARERSIAIDVGEAGRDATYREILCNLLLHYGEMDRDTLVTEAITVLASRGRQPVSPETARTKLDVLIAQTTSMFKYQPLRKTWRLIPGCGRTLDSGTLIRLFGFSSSSRDNSSRPIPRQWHVAISMVRTSKTVKSLKSSLADRDRVEELIKFYWRRYHASDGDLPEAFPQGYSGDDVPTTFMGWQPYHIEHESSSVELFANGAKSKDVESLLDSLDVQAGDFDTRLKVELICNGWDGASSNNKSWSSIQSRWSFLDFQLCVVTNPQKVSCELTDERAGQPSCSFFDVDILASLYSPDSIDDVTRAKREKLRPADLRHHEQFLFMAQSIDCLKLDYSLAKRFPGAYIEPVSENPFGASCTSRKGKGRNRFTVDDELDEPF